MKQCSSTAHLQNRARQSKPFYSVEHNAAVQESVRTNIGFLNMVRRFSGISLHSIALHFDNVVEVVHAGTATQHTIASEANTVECMAQMTLFI